MIYEYGMINLCNPVSSVIYEYGQMNLSNPVSSVIYEYGKMNLCSVILYPLCWVYKDEPL